MRTAAGGKTPKGAGEGTGEGTGKAAAKRGGGGSVVERIPLAGKTKTGAKARVKAGVKAPAKGTPEASDGPAVGKTKAPGRKAPGRKALGKKARLPPRKAFLVAATLHDGEAVTGLRVYAAVVRSAEAALAAVRSEIGEAATVELTGSLSTRMAKTLGLTADEIRQI